MHSFSGERPGAENRYPAVAETLIAAAAVVAALPAGLAAP